jgi:hypothetical protein
MNSAQPKLRSTNVAGFQAVPVPPQPVSPARSFEEVLRQCSSQISKVQRQFSLLRGLLLRAFPWLNRGRATTAKHFTPRPLATAFAWLKRSYVSSATKRLRVAETVSLGEKRFVAILRVDGCEFLIGGGTSGISLLAQVEKPVQSSNAETDVFVRREFPR